MSDRLTKGEKAHTHIALTIFSITSLFPILWILVASFTPRYDIPALSKRIVAAVTFKTDPSEKYLKNIENVYDKYKNTYGKVLDELEDINEKIEDVNVKTGSFAVIFNKVESNMKLLQKGLADYKSYNIEKISLSREINDELKTNKDLSSEKKKDIENLKNSLLAYMGTAQTFAEPLKNINSELDKIDLEKFIAKDKKTEKEFTNTKLELKNIEKNVEEIVGVSIFNNYSTLIFETSFIRWFLNSVLVTVLTTFVGLFFAATAAFAFSQFKFAGRKFLLYFFLFTQMFPGALLIVALYKIMNMLGLLDSMLGLVVAYTTISLPFCVWMLKSYFDTIPVSIMESAKIDGLSYWGQFYKMALPLSLPGIAVTSFFSFITAWNEFLLALIFLTSESKMTVAVGLRSFIGYENTLWDVLTAGSIVMTLPVLLFFVFAQRWIISGLTSGAVKG